MIAPDATAVARYTTKANVVTAAWKSLFNAVPTKHAIVLSMAVAEFETHLGDAGGSWKGEHNWGGLHKRSLTASESSTLSAKGINPTDGDAALTAARSLVAATGPNEALHIDDSPTGKYFVWFWAFPNDVEAAKKFLQTLVGNRPAVRALIDQGTPDDIARAMYASKYYSGVHKGDDEANIRDYARNVADKAQGIDVALAAWDPTRATDPDVGAPAPMNPFVANISGAPVPHGTGLVFAVGAALGLVVTVAILRSQSRPAGAPR